VDVQHLACPGRLAKARPRSLMWWTAPAPGIEESDRCVESDEGSRPHASCHDRFGYRQERVEFVLIMGFVWVLFIKPEPVV
jgi:hypothetical protein